ncbi:oligosaccharide flippase family protein [Vibrio sp. BS-M-Sm-2]|uniref:oligosaccharide flippase family protein n=1 Tax=Vibrio sp. BS-M-Sm-2 TaxID=3241167 RepID=UPI003558263C
MNNKLKNIIWYSGEKYVTVLMSFITTVILARVLEPSILGDIVLLQSFVILFNIVTLLAMDSIFIKRMTDDDNYIEAVYFLKIISSILASLLYFTYVSIDESSVEFSARLVLGLPLLLSFTTFVDVILMKDKLIYKLSTRTILLYIIIGFIKCLLILNTSDIFLICLLLIVDQVAVRVFTFCYGIINKLTPNKLLFNKNTFSYCLLLLNEGKFLVLSSFFLVGFVRTNQLLVSYFLGSESLAYFSMPIKIVDGLTILISTYTASVYPYLLSSIKSHGSKNTALRYFSGVTKIGVLIATIVIFLSEDIILFIFGAQYVNSIPILKIYAFGIIFNYIFVASGRWFVAVSETNFVATRNIMAFSLNLILSFTLVPHYGINGAAWSAMISWCLAGYVSCIFSKNNRWLLILIPRSLFKFVRPL